MCGRIIVKKKCRIAIHHPTGGDVILIVKKKRRITIHHPTSAGVM